MSRADRGRRAPVWRRWGGDVRGLAAVEFAILAPVLILVLLGSTELSDALTCRQHVVDVANTVSDLIAQDSQVSTSEESDVFAAAQSILFPYSSSSLSIVLTSVVSDANGVTTVGWSDALNGTPYTAGAPISVPSGIVPTGKSVILAEISYPYTPPLGAEFTGTITMKSKSYSLPRVVDSIPRVS